ncbi:23S rRNA (guanine(745)-N(1))-methyltransferase [Shewanella sp. Actino-trap-3]|jgi:23S rRNA (guanine745-N1)-methyltransferase|uniref:23S rRNA (guanine(745)-N(1))-methyltransferase n=1 Tax=Shewanella sp. Actino-trap-3 TaxID=2058331 RepID=UPI000C337ED0|nr:23S rRNA (guanine(745)-N(1))-methyltransferase [Shewanella sp. Actino-trap-3]PKG77848.1 23S rRNA (guanine(745)-N(1))-methyltransferase [Shewanella sp. Actino-trap-3]|tara:strand:+ start:17680 stop:18522 length:843 start_codon:yes stop_codon:yes gene_type:complete
MSYICPICSAPLVKQQNAWQCEQRHQFDCAKEGYVNLLPVQKKKTKDPGDNKEMMFARREFLNQGFYQPLSDKVNQLAFEYAPDANKILDIGCGEGYYSHRLFEALQSVTQSHCELFGVDISKSAIRYAAKRYSDLHFCVASAFEMPLANNSFDLAIRIYAPSKIEELQRVIKPGGILITVSPGPTHHYALKKKIYSEPKLHPQGPLVLDGFTYLAHEALSYSLSLTHADDIDHFLNMTPYAWKLSDSQKSQIIEQGLECEIDFKIEIHQREQETIRSLI